MLLLNICEILDLNQGFMSTWGDLLSFSVPGGQEKLLGYDLPVGDQYPR